MTNSLQILTTLGSNAVESAINEYTYWHFVNAIVFVLFGFILMFGAYKFYKSSVLEDEDVDKIIKNVISVLSFLLGILFIFLNLTNILSPRAYAIHQLIVDVTHK